MKRIHISLAAILLLACSSSDLSPDNMTCEDSPNLSLEISVSPIPQTKGALVESPAEMGSIGIYCAMTGVGTWSTTTEFQKLTDRLFYVSSDGSCTIYGDPEPWDYVSLNDKYTIFSYSPHSGSQVGISPRISNGELVIDYVVPENSADQPDLMYALPCKDITPQIVNGVSLSFCHTLSCVSFGVMSSANVKIEDIEITGVVSSGTLSWDSTTDSPVWSLGDVADRSFVVDVVKYTTGNNSIEQLNDEQGYLMMIPQILTDSVEVILTLDNSEQRTLTIPSGSEWVAGSQYRYVISLDDNNITIFNSTQLSNCYIIHPIPDKQTIVQIPIEDRINDFWKNYSGEDSNRIKSGNETDDFCIELSWHDFDDKFVLNYDIIDDADDKMAAQIYIPADYQEGNLVFYVRDNYDGSTDVLWSWHLWLTDYDPDAIANANQNNIKAGVDTAYYRVGYEGTVHRYADIEGIADSARVWSGIYKDKFIMDRNIGERNAGSTTSSGEGTVFYQFGRKEPFPNTYVYYTSGLKQAGVRTYSSCSYITTLYYVIDMLFSSSASTNNWCGTDEARNPYYIWFDKNILASGYSEGKSIFDPSPLGWRVPVSDTWNSFNGNDSSCSVGKYTLSGYRAPSVTGVGEIGYTWSANPITPEYGYYFHHTATTITSPEQIGFKYGLPIRAIQE